MGIEILSSKKNLIECVRRIIILQAFKHVNFIVIALHLEMIGIY